MISIKKANLQDIDWMVKLSYQKRTNYQNAKPDFWKMATDSNEVQSEYFSNIINDDSYIALVCDCKTAFIIGNIIQPPKVYNSGLTLMIDDFCIENNCKWDIHGRNLLDEIIKIAKSRDISQIIAVSGDHDIEKNLFLEKHGLICMSRWYSKRI